jgi:hypothetical protein
MDQDVGENVDKRKARGQKKICHLTLVLERLFKYVFHEDFEVTSKKTIDT